MQGTNNMVTNGALAVLDLDGQQHMHFQHVYLVRRKREDPCICLKVCQWMSLGQDLLLTV
jgi:hypothetical protein